MDIGVERHLEPNHLGPVIGIPEHQIFGNYAVADDLALVVDVAKKQIKRFDPLNHSGLNMRPLGSRNDARNHVKGQDAIDSLLFRVNQKRDAKVIKFTRRSVRAEPKIINRKRRQPLTNQGSMGSKVAATAEQLIIKAAPVVPRQQSGGAGVGCCH